MSQITRSGLFTLMSEYDDNVRVWTPFFSRSVPESGLVRFEIHSFPESHQIMCSVNSIINTHEDNTFSGKWLVVALWKNLQSPTSNNVSWQY